MREHFARMASKSLQIDALLRGAFTPTELSLLREQSSFKVAVASVNSMADFERLCDEGQRILERLGVIPPGGILPRPPASMLPPT